MTRDEFGEKLNKIVYWVENKGKLSPKFDSKVVYGMKEWYDETEYFRKPPAPSLKQQKAAYNIYTKYKIKEWGENNRTPPRRISTHTNINDDDNDYCYACMNTGRQYYCDDVYGPCIECYRPEIMNHPSE